MKTNVNFVFGSLAAVLGSGAAMVDITPAANPLTFAQQIEGEKDHIGALELAERLMRADGTIELFDLRTLGEFQAFHIPGAQPIALEALASRQLPRNKTIVLYSEGTGHAAQAWVLLRMRGYRDVMFLREGLYEWMSRVDQPRLATDATYEERAEFDRASKLSRFFGGSPEAEVPRSEVPVGYWTDPKSQGGTSIAPASVVNTKKIRRRGC
jgi:rhodanese-related sulfurtransferase